MEDRKLMAAKLAVWMTLLAGVFTLFALGDAQGEEPELGFDFDAKSGVVQITTDSDTKVVVNAPDYCGEGPVEIPVRYPITCEDDCKPYLSGDRNIGYDFSISTCHLRQCFETVTEYWTDYPECGGERIEHADR